MYRFLVCKVQHPRPQQERHTSPHRTVFSQPIIFPGLPACYIVRFTGGYSEEELLVSLELDSNNWFPYATNNFNCCPNCIVSGISSAVFSALEVPIDIHCSTAFAVSLLIWAEAHSLAPISHSFPPNYLAAMLSISGSAGKPKQPSSLFSSRSCTGHALPPSSLEFMTATVRISLIPN